MLQNENLDQTNRVRQGVTGHNVSTVLVLGTIGVVIVFFLAYWYFFASAPNPAGVS